MKIEKLLKYYYLKKLLDYMNFIKKLLNYIYLSNSTLPDE